MADVTDADAFEKLQGHATKLPRATILDQRSTGGLHIATNPNQGGFDEQTSLQTNWFEADDPDTTSTVVVNQFPFGSLGAPIPGMPHRTSTYEASQDTSMESMLAPFQSKKYWQIACWAKTSDASSSDVGDLLMIVHAFLLLHYCL